MIEKINEVMHLLNEIQYKTKFRREILRLSKQGVELCKEMKVLAEEGE